MLFLFDFDLTLVSARGRLPRMTRYALRWIIDAGHEVGIVTNNRLAPTMISELGLRSTVPIDRIVVSTSKYECRTDLVARWFNLVQSGAVTPFFYFDDLESQVDAVKTTFAGICGDAYHIDDIQILYKCIGQCLKAIHVPNPV